MAGFETVVGQEPIVEHLKKAISTGKISHAYIINGDRAAGKEYIAGIFARALQYVFSPLFRPFYPTLRSVIVHYAQFFTYFFYFNVNIYQSFTACSYFVNI